MINVSHDLEIKDRWPLNVYVIPPGGYRQFAATGTDYILMRNASFESTHTKLNAANAALAISSDTSYTVSCLTGGSAFVICYPGLRSSDERYFVQTNLEMGHLSYMDGGTNTTALHPGRLGEPVVNYVHFPRDMRQTLHTHPSHRIGLVLSGRGRIELNDGKFFAVEEGSAFFMARNELHNFITEEVPVVLFVFAPDSGEGPTDETNALKVRTYIGQKRNE